MISLLQAVEPYQTTLRARSTNSYQSDQFKRRDCDRELQFEFY